MSWEDQGRQYHMWFGHGTAPVKAKDASDDGIFGRNGLAQRIQAVAHGAVGALPQALRARAAAQYDAGNLERLSAAMTAWSRGTKLGVDEFAERFFGRPADDPAVEQLHRAALGVGLAQSHAELREASDQLADAMKAIGLDRWPQFLADAQERARDPATVAAVEKSRQAPDIGKIGRDAIRSVPFSPVEVVSGVGTAILAGKGAAAAARAAGAAILRRVLPKSQSRPLISRQKQDGHVQGTPQNQNRLKQGKPTSTFDGNSAQADALTQEAWDKGTLVPGRPGVRDYNFGRPIGRGPRGGSQSTVRVHQDSAGNIHGHPSGPETP